MQNVHHNAGLFPALLKHWRRQRGLSQLDLALLAGVSSRHVSFLETARSAPSSEMVLRLGAALNVPLRHVNEMLRAAGHEAVYAERADAPVFPEEVASVLQLMKAHQEPYPLIVIDRVYDVVDVNAGALAVFNAISPQLKFAGAERLNLARMTFEPQGVQEVLVNFDEIGRALLWRIQREVLAEPGDGPLRRLLSELLKMPTVDERWRDVDLSVSSSPSIVVHLRSAAYELRFLTMVTAFQAPQMVTLDELRIETWFPADEATATMCHELAAAFGVGARE